MKASLEDTVTISGHPTRLKWMSELVGQNATVKETRHHDDGNTYLVEGTHEAFGAFKLWIGGAYLQPERDVR